MKKAAYILPVLFLLAAGSGCTSGSLVSRMKAYGVTHLNTSKIVLRGMEADVGSDVIVEIEEHFLIQEIWDTIYQSRPATIWYSSGFRQADFYAPGYPKKPAFTLLINESDACHIKGEKDRFRCPKLHALFMKLLKEAYDSQVGNKQDK